jgi:hypothetical protein
MNPVNAATRVVSVPVAAMKANPLVWLVVFGIVAAVVLRYRTTIAGWLTGAPLIGERTGTFINRG